jgi:hypothetical protein
MKRLSVFAVLASAAVAAAAMLSATGSAHPTAAPRSITFMATSTGGFEPPGKPRRGATSGFSDRLRNSDGTVTGRDIGVCTLDDLKGGESFCRVQMLLSNGQLSLQGVLREDRHSFVFVVIGGAGAYEGAGGEAQVTPLTDTRTRIAVRLTQ